MSTDGQKGIFDGLVISSFGWAIVGPLTMKFFADHGATVIRVETAGRPCTLRISAPYKDGQPGLDRSGYFNHFSANILSLALNMEHPQAGEAGEKAGGGIGRRHGKLSPRALSKNGGWNTKSSGRSSRISSCCGRAASALKGRAPGSRLSA